MLVRYSMSAVGSFFVVTGLLLFMSLLLRQDLSPPKEVAGLKIDWVVLKTAPPPPPEQIREAPQRPEPQTLPERPVIAVNRTVDAPPRMPPGTIEGIGNGSGGTGVAKTPSEFQRPPLTKAVAPIFRVPPAYPATAEMRGIEGWVEVGFTVTPAGSVVGAYVIDGDPTGVFDGAAMKAISKWKYPPSDTGETRHMTYRFTFELQEKR